MKPRILPFPSRLRGPNASPSARQPVRFDMTDDAGDLCFEVWTRSAFDSLSPGRLGGFLSLDGGHVGVIRRASPRPILAVVG